MRGGLGYIRRHGLIGPLVLSGALSQFGTSAPMTPGLILLAEERGWGPGGIGWIVGAFGVGAASSALVLTLVPRFPRAGALQNLTLVVGSAGIGALALAPDLSSAVALALQRDLAAIGHHRGPSPVDILIALTAQQHRLTVLHVDDDFAAISKGRPGIP
ncbi:hypothetical protein ACLF6K_30930 [Streptomyces xanthophaeus]|uniref:hypothetical protein n=1 Tax=Streptomyces xanthophaeus TaxID=67385 RepID=UPI003990195F